MYDELEALPMARENHGSAVTVKPRWSPTAAPSLTLDQVRKLPAAVDVTTGAQAFGVSRSSMYQAIAQGRCPVQTITVGRRLKILTASLIEVLEGDSGSPAA
jgi:hypothetical protein